MYSGNQADGPWTLVLDNEMAGWKDENFKEMQEFSLDSNTQAQFVKFEVVTSYNRKFGGLNYFEIVRS